MTKVTVKPPDGGWGWVVVSSAFLIHLIADGVIYSFGCFFLEFTKYFKRPESTTAWIGSVLTAMPLLTGPIAAALSNRYGCMTVTVVGGLLASLGFILASLSTSIPGLILTFGVIPGFGLSLCYIAALDIVARYFDKRRSFAMGLAVCGGGVGTFFFAPVTQRFILWYGWEITTALLSVSFIAISMCGFTMKNLKPETKEIEMTKTPSHIDENILNPTENHRNIHKSYSTASLPTFEANKIHEEAESSLKRSYSYIECIGKSKWSTIDPCVSFVETEQVGSKTEDKMAKTNFWRHIKIIPQWVWAKLLDTRQSMANSRFLLFVLSNCLLYTWYDVPYVYIQITAVHQGYSDQFSSSLISSVGLANLVGNVVLGYLGDKKWIRPTLLYTVCIMLSGASVILLPFCLEWNYWAAFTTCAVFGATIAANCALAPVILVKFVSLEGFANGYGLLLLLQGVGNLVGPPLAGMLSDWMGSNKLSFIVAGAGIFASSLILLLPVFQTDEEIQPGHNDDNFASHQTPSDDASRNADICIEKVYIV